MKTLITGLLVALAVVGVASGSSKPRTVSRACFGIQHGQPPSRYDVNVYGKHGRLCIVGRRGKPGKNGKAGARGLTGAAGAKGDTGARGASGPAGPQGPPGADGLGNGVIYACVSQGGSLQLNVNGQPCDNEGHLPLKLVVVNP